MPDLLTRLKEIDYSIIPIGFKVVITGLIDRTEAAERERDELRAEQAEHDEQIARMESKFSLVKRALDSKTARCEKAEAELRRRDAAAGEPVICPPVQYLSKYAADDGHCTTGKLVPNKRTELRDTEWREALDAAGVKWEVKKF